MFEGAWILVFAAITLFWGVPAVLLWAWRDCIPNAWLVAAAVVLTIAPVAGALVAWYVVIFRSGGRCKSGRLPHSSFASR